jgi:hypothetical protein
MAEHREADSDDWGEQWARGTFLWAILLAAGFVGAVVAFVLSR